MKLLRCTFLLCLGLNACVGTTGSDLVEFNAYAAGPEGTEPNEPLVFETARGWSVLLTKGKIHIGAMYLNRAFPVAGAQGTACVLPGLYVASVPGGVDVDVLSGIPVPFSVQGQGTADRSLAGELWLTGGDVNAAEEGTVILDVAGAATKGAESMAFEGRVTIGQNRAIPPSNPSMPGSNPICKQRIVSPIPLDLTPRQGGSLLLRINPAGWFANVDFAALRPSTSDPSVFQFADDNSDQPSLNLFQTGVKSTVGTYQFTWLNQATE